ncbi:NAD(P)-dependent dehydrogenase (short-subunit alcohol dehydrogenase family) [Chitinophaga niastensis]|uniref:NAD(P)-dependent dehydrogenase (Short-subunit alcohol dehydrogenase family) n=1 Tax=Chitinophaga niastensis TaxID=536980 RepID=A0A2P8HVT1_CHINA|nr:short chain dehydrogenase [Chitinophaga niastensis]PSL50337.1 NAD(P)-dependent dehydrogenase (short-subunit alcohol dehydrogenase family) [Chitinophaga niastensis]
MKILIIGAGGTIGKLLVAHLSEKHEVISAGRKSGDVRVDISSAASIENMFRQSENIDACICVAGESYAGELLSLTQAQLNAGITNKLLGQINLVRIGQHYLNDEGSFTLTSGKMGDKPAKHTAGKAFVNGGINSFVKAAAMEMERDIRVNAVSPAKVTDIAVTELVAAYLKSVEDPLNGEIIKIGY